MWYLLAATIASGSLVIILKIFDLKGVDLYTGITVNYIVGAVLSYLFAPVMLPASEIFSAGWFPISMVIGAMFMLSFVVFAISAQKSGVAVTTISGRAAVVLPVTFAFLFLGEEATAVKIAMLVLIVISMFLILKKDGNQLTGGTKNNLWLVLLPLAVFLFNGANDTTVQYAQRIKIPSPDYIPVFTGTMFMGGVATGLVCYIISSFKRYHKPTLRDLGWGSLLGFMNWICTIGIFYGLEYLDGSVFFPLYYTGAIIIATIAGVRIFREKLSRLNYLGIALAIVAIVVLSMQ